LKVLKKIDVRSFVKFYFYYMAIVGFIASLFVAVPMLIFGSFSGDFANNFGSAFRLIVIVVVPVFYGLMGLIFGYVGAIIINFILKISGGIEMEFADKNAKQE